jgi:hypothetical protein
MIYKRPMVENNLIDPSDSIVFIPIIPNACGPIITPEIIKPMMDGIFILRNKIGERRMIKSKIENKSTGFFNGR